MKFCEECGAQLEDSAVFCEECGAQIVQETSPIEDSTVQNQEKKSSPNKKNPLGILGLILVIIIIGILAAIYFLKDSDSPSETAPTTAITPTEAPLPETTAGPTPLPTTDYTATPTVAPATEPMEESAAEPSQELTPEPTPDVSLEDFGTPIEVNSSNIKEYCGTWKNSDYDYLYLSIKPYDSTIYLTFEYEYSSGMHISCVDLVVDDLFKTSSNTYTWNYTDSWGNQGILTAEFTTSGLYLTAVETYYYDGYSVETARTLFRLVSPYDWDTDFYNTYEPSAPAYNDNASCYDYSNYYDGYSQYTLLFVVDQYKSGSYDYLILQVDYDGTLWLAQFENLNDYINGYVIDGFFTYYPSSIIDGYPVCVVTDAYYYPLAEDVG